MTENGESPVRQAVAGLLHELCSAVNLGNSVLGDSLDGAVDVAREAVQAWTSRNGVNLDARPAMILGWRGSGNRSRG